MGSIVSGHADDLAWLHRGQKLNLVQGGFGFPALEGTKYVALDGADFIVQEASRSQVFCGMFGSG